MKFPIAATVFGVLGVLLSVVHGRTLSSADVETIQSLVATVSICLPIHFFIFLIAS